MLTGILWGLVVVFTGIDAAAHFTKYKYGETFSASVWWLEKRYPWMHLVVGAALVVLFTHLEFQLP